MITREEISKLAGLSRLRLTEDEISRMQADMTSILGYVDKLKSASVKGTEEALCVNRNVLREDIVAHKSGTYTDKLIKAAPKHTDEHVKVKKILGGSQ